MIWNMGFIIGIGPTIEGEAGPLKPQKGTVGDKKSLTQDPEEVVAKKSVENYLRSSFSSRQAVRKKSWM